MNIYRHWSHDIYELKVWDHQSKPIRYILAIWRMKHESITPVRYQLKSINWRCSIEPVRYRIQYGYKNTIFIRLPFFIFDRTNSSTRIGTWNHFIQLLRFITPSL